MNATLTPRLSLARLTAAVAVALGCGLAAAAPINEATYDAAKKEVQSQHKTDKERCEPLRGNAQDVCESEADGREKVAMAHLKFQRSGKAEDQVAVREAMVEARYDIAKERCDDLSGDAKNRCEAEAKAAHEQGKANVKRDEKVAEARDEAREARLKAEYQLAKQQCDERTGAAKNACEAALEARFPDR